MRVLRRWLSVVLSAAPSILPAHHHEGEIEDSSASNTVSLHCVLCRGVERARESKRHACHIPITMQTTSSGRTELHLVLIHSRKSTSLFAHVPGPDGPDEEVGEVVGEARIEGLYIGGGLQ